MSLTEQYINREKNVSAQNYNPLPIVISEGKGVWVKDVEGKKHLDMLSAYSALNQGHCHPRILSAAMEQMKKLTLTSRAFHNDVMVNLLDKLTKLSGYDKALLMNTGAEAVETAIKAARRWGYKVKGVKENQAEIIVCTNNFHGRTTTIVGFSTDELSREGYGPFAPGFKIVTYGDAEALEKAITKNTVAFLVEPIQGEAGVIVPPKDYLKKCREITSKHNLLLMADEIQTGLGRTGKMFCVEHSEVKPDVLIVGKALGGGVYPVSGVLADKEIMDVAFEPGSHGSTFGGNPLACVIASESLDVIVDEGLVDNSKLKGEYFKKELEKISTSLFKEIRGLGLMIAIELEPKAGLARPFTNKLKEFGVLAKETHGTIIRFSPPLIINKEEIDFAIEKISLTFVN